MFSASKIIVNLQRSRIEDVTDYRQPQAFPDSRRQDYRLPPTLQDARRQGFSQQLAFQYGRQQHNYATSQPMTPFSAKSYFQNNQQTHNQVKLKVYDGTTNWEAYYKQFQIFSRRQGWGHDEQMEYLFLHLSGTALEHYYITCMDADDKDVIADTMNWRFGK